MNETTSPRAYIGKTGRRVHAMTPDGQTPLCGNLELWCHGQRSPCRPPRLTTEAVTCKACMAQLALNAAANSAMQTVD